jgi:hypothetical protein
MPAHDAADDIPWEDLKEGHDPEEMQEVKAHRRIEINRLKTEGLRMASDPEHAVQLLAELNEEFPEGKNLMGPFEQALFHLATHVCRASARSAIVCQTDSL